MYNIICVYVHVYAQGGRGLVSCMYNIYIYIYIYIFTESVIKSVKKNS